MPKQITPLSDLQVSKAKSQAKETKLFDGGGLFLLVSSQKTGPDVKPLPVSKSWRFKYRFGGKEKLLSFGTTPKSLLPMPDSAGKMPGNSLPTVLILAK